MARQCATGLIWLRSAVVLGVAVCSWLAYATAVCAEVRTGSLGCGTTWETPWRIVDSGQDGPTVLIVGGMHGNEPAGRWAAEQIQHWPIARGKLVVLPQVNRLGLAADSRWAPDYRNDRKLRDLNRNFPTDVLLFPGGSGSKQGKALGEAGRSHVRQFTREGGGVIGICAGAYLCSSHYSWSLGLMNAAVFSPHFESTRGQEAVLHHAIEHVRRRRGTPSSDSMGRRARYPRACLESGAEASASKGAEEPG